MKNTETTTTTAPSENDWPISAWLTALTFDWREATRGCRRRSVAAEETIFLAGQTASTAYVIEEGRVRLTAFSADGKERHLMIVGPNGLVGDCGLLSSKTYVVSAVAASDAVLSTVQTDTLLHALDHNPQLLRQHHAMTSTRLQVLLQHLAMQGPNSGQRRVCHHLLGLMRSYGKPVAGGVAISIHFTQQEMGNICGLSRVSVSHIFTELERLGVITRSARLVVVLEPQQLVELAVT
jgi:CRP/FNR family transcriptional regulator